MGEDPRPRRRQLGVRDRAVTREAVEALFRGVWKLAFVLVLTLAVLFAVGWVVRALSDDGSRSETVTTTNER